MDSAVITGIITLIVGVAGGFGVAWLARGTARDKLNAEKGLKNGEREDHIIERFSARIITLEAKVEQRNDENRQLGEKYNEDIRGVTKKLTDAEAKIVDLQGKVTAADLKITDLEAKVMGLEAAAKAAVKEVEAAVDDAAAKSKNPGGEGP